MPMKETRMNIDHPKVRKFLKSKEFLLPPITQWKYAPFLPIVPKKFLVSMKEGGTTLLPGLKNQHVSYKLEFENPTGSFKDRGSTIEISHALANNYKQVICASTGNMGASIAAYAARANIPATIVVPRHVPENKIEQIEAYGAKLLKIKGDYTKALKKTWKMAEKNKKAMLTGDYPLRMQGQKTIAYEIAEQSGWKAPENVIVPVGNGTLLTSLYTGFWELRHIGFIKKIPRIIGVQAKGCNPLTKAWKKGAVEFTPIKDPKTIAGAIECGNPVFGQETLLIINETKGNMVSVSDSRMKKAKASLAHDEGLYSEYSGAAVQAVVEDYSFKGKTIALLCGHGLKE
jgi:threonine synthase